MVLTVDIGCVGTLFARLELRDETGLGREKAAGDFKKLESVISPVERALRTLDNSLSQTDANFEDLNHTIESTAINSLATSEDIEKMGLSLTDADYPLQQVKDGLEDLHETSGILDEDVEDLGSIFEETTEKAEGLGDALEDTTGKAEELGETVEEVGQQTEEGLQEATSVMETLEDRFMSLGYTFMDFGDFIEGLTGRADSLSTILEKVAGTTAMDETALKSLMMELGSADITLDDITSGMEAFSKKSVDNESRMRSLIEAYDKIADVLEIDMYDAVEQVGSALELFGLKIDDISSKQDVFTYVFTHSLEGVEGFLGGIERLGDSIIQSGLSLEEYASIFLILEERGLQGRAGILAMQTAMSETEQTMQDMADQLGMTSTEFQESQEYSEKYFTTLLENLGITTGELEFFKREMQDATGITEKLNETQNESYSVWDNLRSMIDKAHYSLGEFLSPISFLGPLLQDLGPIMMSLSVASSYWGSINLGVVAPSLTAITVAGLPLWLVLGAIAAAVLAIIVVFKNWGKISDWFSRQLDRISNGFSNFSSRLENIKGKISERLGKIKDSIGGFFSKTSEKLGGFKGILEMALLGPFGPLKKMWDTNWGGIKDILTGVFNEMKTKASETMTIIREITVGKIENIIDFMKTLPEKVYNTVRDAAKRVIDAIKDAYAMIEDAVSGVIDRLNPLNWDIPGLSPFLTAFEHAGQAGMESLFKGLNKVPAPEIAPIGVYPRTPQTMSTRINHEFYTPSAGEGPSTVEIHIHNMHVRSQEDIQKIAKELGSILQRQKGKRRGL